MEESLFSGYNFFTRLSVVLVLFNLKIKGVLTDRIFTELLELLQEIFPKGNMLSNRSYGVKKILCPMSLDYVKIHACHNDCNYM